MTDSIQIDRPVDQPDALPGQSTPTPATGSAVQQADSRPRPADPLTRKSQWSNWTVLALIILCFFVIVRFRPFDSANPQQRTGVGKTLPRLRLQPLVGDARPMTLANLTGQVVLIHLWQPQSPTCRESLPQIAALRREFGDQKAFRLVAVACNEGRNGLLSQLRRNARTALRMAEMDLPVHADVSNATCSAVAEVAGLRSLPTTLILDRLGRVRGVWVGFSPGTEDQMKRLVQALLAEA